MNLFDDDVGHHLAAHLHLLIDSGDLRVRLPQHPRAVAGGKKAISANGFPYGGLG